MTRILYLAHDTSDSAIWRRVAMLAAGGAEVTVAGFDRGKGAPAGPVIGLGRTTDGRMVSRAALVALRAVTLPQRLRHLPAPDVILARNLEMLLLAARLRHLWPAARLVYEVLDIHRMMLGDGRRAQALRGLERRLLRDAALVLTSSPGFLRAYFQPFGITSAPLALVENKVLGLAGAVPPPARPVQRVLTIGWFGILRCPVSLACLDAVTRAAPGRYRVILRGRPSRDALPDFDATVAANPDLVYGGPYRNPEDLADLYGAVDLAWLVDRFDPGLNSDWLLPNRLYEGCLHGAVPVALAGTEVAAFLTARGLGLILPAPTGDALAACMEMLTEPRLAALRARVTALPQSAWVATAKDCTDLVAQLAGTTPRLAMHERPAA